MSLPLALLPQEDSNMEDAIILRDKDTAMVQADPTRTGKARDTPAADLWKARTRRTSKVGRQNPKRVTRSTTSAERNPFETPTRPRIIAVRPSGSDGDTSNASEAGASHTTEYWYEEETPRALRTEVLVQGLRGLATQAGSAIQTEARTREHQYGQLVQEGQQLVGELQGKFREVDGQQGQIATALSSLTHQFQVYAQQEQMATEQRFRTLALEAEQQRRQTQELAAYLQAQQVEKTLVLPEGLAAMIAAAQVAPQQRAPTPAPASLQAELEKMMKDTLTRVKGKQPRVESVRDSPGEGRVPSHSPPVIRRRNKSPSPPPRRSHGKRRREEEPEPSGRAMGGNGGGNGGGRRRYRRDDSPDSSDSSSSSEGDRKRRRKSRHHRRAETQSPAPHSHRKGETPKQAKIPFFGKPEEDVRHWIDRIEILMDLQPRVTWDDKTRILWASLEFTGSAASFWRNFKERLSVKPRLGTWDRFKKELLVQYGNQTSQEQAKQKMDRFRQTGPIDDYLNEMQNLEWDARVGPIVMKSMILTGINSSLEQRLSAAIEEPTDFADWLAWVRKVGRKDAEVKTRHEILRGKETAKTRETQAPKTREKRVSKRQRPPRTHKKAHEESPHQPPPATGSLGATQVEKDQWAKEEKCLHCGRQGHWAKDCYSTSKVRLTGKIKGSSERKKKRVDNSSRRKEQEGEDEKRQRVAAFRSRITVLGEE